MNSAYSMHMARPIEQFMYKVYGWMFAGLALTAVTSFSLFHFFPHILYQIIGSLFMWILVLAQVGLVLGLSAATDKLSYSTAVTLFLVYSCLTGISLSPIFLVFTLGSIYSTFLVASGMFGTMALYGYYTETDLTSMGNIVIMGLYGLILATIVNIFIASSSMSFLLSIGGVIIFTLLTAYEVQKIKKMSMHTMTHEGSENKLALLGALSLYLNFINIFIRLLHLIGQKKR